jgi:hypothetical protein
MSIVTRIRSYLRSTAELDQTVEEQLERERAEYLARLARDRFRFPDDASYERFHRKHGRRHHR